MQTRFIYTLSNPLTQQTFYVGVTCVPRIRRRQHFKKYSTQFNGMPPVFTVIDVIQTRNHWIGLALERYWINTYKYSGHELINRRSIGDEFFNMDYSKYLSELNKSNVMNYRTIPNRTTNV